MICLLVSPPVLNGKSVFFLHFERTTGFFLCFSGRFNQKRKMDGGFGPLIWYQMTRKIIHNHSCFFGSLGRFEPRSVLVEQVNSSAISIEKVWKLPLFVSQFRSKQSRMCRMGRHFPYVDSHLWLPRATNCAIKMALLLSSVLLFHCHHYYYCQGQSSDSGEC
jgi:hypothetical protein